MSSDPDDVPSPIDLRSMADSRDWADSAMLKRPWREEFFHRIAQELACLDGSPCTVLELGSGPGFLAQRILEALSSVDYIALDFSASMHTLAKECLGDRSRMVPKHDRPIPRKTNALRAGARSALICGRSLLESVGRPQRVRNLQVARPARGD